ncbi:MAG: cytochrome c3 family protein [Terracidiphilus sp.]
MKRAFSIALALAVSLVLAAAAPRFARAQVDCLACHADKDMKDDAGRSLTIDGDRFHQTVHGSLKCNDCHTDVKDVPHAEKLAKVKCEACHSSQASELAGSVHSNAADHPCTSCHGNAHAIFPKEDSRSAVYALNIPRTCGACHGVNGMASKHGQAAVFPSYMDSIHGMALSKEGLLVAASCKSCHGSHHILSRNNPASPTSKANIPKTCGNCHAGITANYMEGVHGKAVAKGDMKAPVCSDCHTAHAIEQPTAAGFRSQSTPICGSCHKEKFSTYRDTFHSQLGGLGGYVETARCWDCHEAHAVWPSSDPRSPVHQSNLIVTCGKCHQGANASFVQYQPHANARSRKLSPALFYVRLFMNLLLAGVLSFFLVHTILWLIRARWDQLKKKPANGGNHA